jgi:hypothetical protein
MSTLSNFHNAITDQTVCLDDLERELALMEAATAFVVPSSSLYKNDTPQPIVVKLSTNGQALTGDLSVAVQDAGGTAQPDVHYTFSPATIVFPAGSADGMTRSVTVTPIPSAITADKTASIKLNPGKLGTVSRHDVTIKPTWCYEFTFENGLESWQIDTFYNCTATLTNGAIRAEGTDTSPCGGNSSGQWFNIFAVATFQFSQPTFIQEITVWGKWGASGSRPAVAGVLVIALNGYENDLGQSAANSTPNTEYEYTRTINSTLTQVWLRAQAYRISSPTTGYAEITRVRVRGTGTNPFSANNCA